MSNFGEEIPKYRKKKGSNKSKSNAKAKHNYVECFTMYDFTFLDKTRKIIHLNSYCDICGKIGSSLEDGKIRSQYQDTYSTNGIKRYIIPWTNRIDEIYEKHKDEIPSFEINFDDKFVNLEGVMKNE